MNEFENKNYYEILNINQDSNKIEIKKAFNILAKKYHPDISKEKNCEEKFKIIYKAYETLYDEDKKLEYDNWLKSKTHCTSEYSNFNHDWEEKHFDPTWIEKVIIEFNIDKLKDCRKYLSNLSNLEKLQTFEFFWLSFWMGSNISINLIKKKIFVHLFDLFFDSIDKSFVLNLANNLVNIEDKKSYTKYVQELNWEIKRNINDESTTDFVVNLINEDNVFDSDVAPILALINYTITKELIQNIEQILNNNFIVENHQSQNLQINTSTSKNKSIWSFVKIFLIIAGVIVLIFFIYKIFSN